MHQASQLLCQALELNRLRLVGTQGQDNSQEASLQAGVTSLQKIPSCSGSDSRQRSSRGYQARGLALTVSTTKSFTSARERGLMSGRTGAKLVT